MQADYRRSGHSVSLLYAHLVFVTKYRRRVFNDAMLIGCESTLRQVCIDLGVVLVEFNGEADHVHLLVQYPPALPISELVRRLKGASARRMRADHTGRCNRARMHGHFWTPSYFAVSRGRPSGCGMVQPSRTVSNMCSTAADGPALLETSGFPNPAQDYFDGHLSLNRHLIPRPAATYLLRVASDALASLGLRAGDELLVDRSLTPRPGCVMVVLIDDERRLGRFELIEGRAMLVTDDEQVPLTADVEPWGVATVAIVHLPLSERI